MEAVYIETTIVSYLETVKERFDNEASGDLHSFLEQMDAWLRDHPHPAVIHKSK